MVDDSDNENDDDHDEDWTSDFDEEYDSLSDDLEDDDSDHFREAQSPAYVGSDDGFECISHHTLSSQALESISKV